MSSSPVGNALVKRRPTSLPPPEKGLEANSTRGGAAAAAATAAASAAAAAAAAAAERGREGTAAVATYCRSSAVARLFLRSRKEVATALETAPAALPSPPAGTTSVKVRHASLGRRTTSSSNREKYHDCRLNVLVN